MINVFLLFSTIEIGSIYWDADEAVKAKKFPTLKEETIPFYLGKLEEIAKQNNGHLALKRLTWADVYFAGVLAYMNFMTERDLTDDYPYLKKVTESVYGLDGIKKLLAKHPKSN